MIEMERQRQRKIKVIKKYYSEAALRKREGGRERNNINK
jgi:hypothetical protein